MDRMFHNNLMEMDAPHVLSERTIGSQMRCVIAALIPALVFGLYMFGARAFAVTALCIAACFVCELALSLILRRKGAVKDFSFAVTGMLIAFSLPSGVPFYIPVIACAFAIIIIKQFFGGTGRNIVNPAVAGIILVNLNFQEEMSTWPAPAIGSPDIPGSAQQAATALEVMGGAEGVMPSNWELFLGFCPGAIGEISALMLLVGGLFLVYKKIIHIAVPISIFVTMMAISFLAGVDPVTSVLAGGAALAGIFMATDPVTSPIKVRGMIVYGIGIGIITMVIRLYTPITEGIFIAIVVMNLFTRGIDRFFAEEMYKKNK